MSQITVNFTGKNCNAIYFVFGSPNLKFDENYLKTTVKMLSMQLFLLDLLSNFIFTSVDCALEIITKKKNGRKKQRTT